MRAPNRQRLLLSSGTELSFSTAGESSTPAVLLLHGTPQSARYFRDVMPELSRAAYVIAPDLPGFGESAVLPTASFPAYGEAVSELLDGLAIGSRYIYLHDFGAPVGLHVAMQAPERVLGLIVQNGNAHRTGLGPQWGPVLAYGSQPNPENEAAATAHLTFEGMRDTYLRGVPSDVAARMPAESWEEDWRVMQLPGRMDKERALIADYARYVARFDAIANYLKRRQPPALMVWGRTSHSSSSPRSCHGWRTCRGWRPIFLTAATCCSRRTRPRPRRSWSTSSNEPNGPKESESVSNAPE